MSDANVTTQHVVLHYNNRTRGVRKRILYTYGQAMHTATKMAEDYPDDIVSLWSQVVIQEDLRPPDFEGEEHRLAERQIGLAERQAQHEASQ